MPGLSRLPLPNWATGAMRRPSRDSNPHGVFSKDQVKETYGGGEIRTHTSHGLSVVPLPVGVRPLIPDPKLGNPDSNQDREGQNLSCCLYTIPQSKQGASLPLQIPPFADIQLSSLKPTPLDRSRRRRKRRAPQDSTAGQRALYRR